MQFNWKLFQENVVFVQKMNVVLKTNEWYLIRLNLYIDFS